MRKLPMALILLVVFGISVFVTSVDALDETTVDLTIGPDEKDGSYLPVLETDTIDVKMTSNVPVDVYIINQEQIYQAFSSDDFEYEKKWSSETNLNVNYKVQDKEQLYYIMIHNPSSTETADVELEYKIYQEIAGEIIEDAAKDACCGLVILPVGLLLVSLVAFGLLLKKKV